MKDRASPPSRQARRDLPCGVYRHRGRKGCFAQTHIKGVYTYLGYFSDAEEARQAVERAKREAGR
jgi:hypothetical protein